MKSDFKGFTLIEILVVTFIISLLFTFTLPHFSSIVLKLEQKKFLHQFVHTISLAATNAISFNKPSYFFIDGHNRTYGLSEKVYSIPENVEIYASGLKEITPGLYYIYFYPDGTANQAEIEIIYGRKKYIININPLTSTIRWKEAG